MKKGFMKIVTKEISCDKDGKGYETTMEIQNMCDEHVVISLVEVIANAFSHVPH